MQFTLQLTGIMAIVALVAGCASQPSGSISRIPATTDAEASQSGLFMQTDEWEHSKPGCKGECPRLHAKTLIFAGNNKLTELIDHGLAMMTGIGEERVPPYQTIGEFEKYFWKTAAPRDEVDLIAQARYRSSGLTVVELTTYQYFTGSAHGITATQFLNWDNNEQKVLGLADILRPGQDDNYVQALEAAHKQWMQGRSEIDDTERWLRTWPFQPSDNFAFTDQGLVVKYDSYEIAPYSSGQPEILIPYNQLKGIVRADYLPS